MKNIILIGAKGKLGQAALNGLSNHHVITVSRSATGCDYQVDITNEESIRRLYEQFVDA